MKAFVEIKRKQKWLFLKSEKISQLLSIQNTIPTMYKKIYNKIKAGINQHGFIYFIYLNLTEQYYKYKFKKLSVDYCEGNIKADELNNVSLNKDSKINQASPFYELKNAFILTGIPHSEIHLLDIGCGYGKVLNFGMMLNFKEVVGIDLDHSAIEKANSNCRQMQKNGYATSFKIFETDATKYVIPKNTNIIYLFNPFGKITMKDVVENIVEYYKTSRKDLYVVYSVPVHQDLFTNHIEFVKIYERLNGPKTKSEMVIFKLSLNN
jgi:SAM-dependent methyltransferase